MTEITLPIGRCTYWECTGWTKGSFCAEHTPLVCIRCLRKPYGSRGLTYGRCIRCYKWWLRHESPQREAILAADRARRTRRRRELGVPERWPEAA